MKKLSKNPTSKLRKYLLTLLYKDIYVLTILHDLSKKVAEIDANSTNVNFVTFDVLKTNFGVKVGQHLTSPLLLTRKTKNFSKVKKH